MNSNPCQCNNDTISHLARQAGAVAVGFATADAVDAATAEGFRRWLAAGCHGSMAYMERYVDLRLDPRLLVEGARTVISMAFPYAPVDGYHHPCISDYALGEDYHIVLRRRLQPVADAITAAYGGQARICIDSAPVLERYWAVRAGVGFIGLNHQLIVPDMGAGMFLAEIITTAAFTPSAPCTLTCQGCRRCIQACPGRVLSPSAPPSHPSSLVPRPSELDARRCVSYLTIEHRGDLPADANLGAMVYGCDVCRRVCPHSAGAPAPLPEFAPRAEVMAHTRATLAAITASPFRRLASGSAMSRISPAQLRRNATHRQSHASNESFGKQS